MRPNAHYFAICLAVAGFIGGVACGDDLFQPFGYVRNGAFLKTSESSASASGLASIENATDFLRPAGPASVSFNLQRESSFLPGYHEHTRPASAFTMSGPISYVGNVGASFKEPHVLGLNTTGIATNTHTATSLTSQLLDTVSNANTTSDDASSLTKQIQDSVASLQDSVEASGDESTAAAFMRVNESISRIQTNLPTAIGDSLTATDRVRTIVEITNLNAALSILETSLLAVDEAATTASAEGRLADDLNGNGNGGLQYVRALVDGEFVTVATIVDIGDLYEFNAFYDSVVVREASNFTSVELMKQHVFYASPGENTWRTGWRTDAFWDEWALGFGDEIRGSWAFGPEVLDGVSYGWLREAVEATRWSTYGTAGVRGMRIEDDFFFEGLGAILGRARVATMIDHDIFGPQLGVGFVAEASMFRFETVLLGLIGYGHAETKQTGFFGEEVIPGALNRSATARTTTSFAGQDDDYFAWHGETRITGSCQLTQHWRFDATWRGILTGPVRSSSAATAWNAPDFGINDHDGETVDASHWFIGLTYTH